MPTFWHHGRGALLLASAGMPRNPKDWAMKQARRTQQYTTDWNALLRAQ